MKSLIPVGGLFLASMLPANAASLEPETEAPDAAHQPRPYVEIAHPDWAANATIYQVNLRQFTPEGTFEAFEAHLPRLKDLGVDIIWLMPIHPIGEKNRKGGLGSYYSVRDYFGVNPEHGNKEDFRRLVRRIHELGMYVILDWVANHSAWDNPLVTEHPDWYIKTREGHFQSTPWRDYDDIIDFDYSQPELRAWMTNAMRYWVEEFDIDGYRCDIASFVPIEFWENLRAELNAIKPVFMLAEAADRDLHKRAFDMTYAWSLWDHLHAITTKGASITGLTEGYIAEHVSIWPRNAYRMNFVTNHDKNSWEGTLDENFGAGLEASIVLTATMEGMPLIYSGQEAGLDRPLAFFEKDTIEWRDHPHAELYRTLFRLKHNNRALWNGNAGGVMERLVNDRMDTVISFVREKDGDKVITLVNLSEETLDVKIDTRYDKGVFSDVFSDETFAVRASTELSLGPWEYRVLSRVQ